MIYTEGWVLFAGHDLEDAKKYIRLHGLSKEDVIINQGKTSQSITVKVRDGREVRLKGNSDPATVQTSGS